MSRKWILKHSTSVESATAASSNQETPAPAPDEDLAWIRPHREPLTSKSVSLESGSCLAVGPVPSIRCSPLIPGDRDVDSLLGASDNNNNNNNNNNNSPYTQQVVDWGRAISHDESELPSRGEGGELRRATPPRRQTSQDSVKSSASSTASNRDRITHKLGRLLEHSRHYLQNPFFSGSPLKPSSSANCLFPGASGGPGGAASTPATPKQHSLDGDASVSPLRGASAGLRALNSSNSSNSSSSSSAAASGALPTKASLTHNWRKYKTMMPCHECHHTIFLVGRTCSCCRIVAHTRCVPVLGIQCGDTGLVQEGQEGALPGLWGLDGPTTSSPASVVSMHRVNSADQTRKHAHRHRSLQACAHKRAIFGQQLPRQARDGQRALELVARLVGEIEARGLACRGIYRISSSQSKVDKLCSYFDTNPARRIDLSSYHPNIMANALKRFLSRLPESLLTSALYGQFIEAAKRHYALASSATARQRELLPVPSHSEPATPQHPQGGSPVADSVAYLAPASSYGNHSPLAQATSEQNKQMKPNAPPPPPPPPAQLDELKQILATLPETNRLILSAVMRHLARVAEAAPENQMSAYNLSIIFGPTLLSSGRRLSADHHHHHHHRSSTSIPAGAEAASRWASSGTVAIVDSVHRAQAIELMITWARELFPSPGDESDGGAKENDRAAAAEIANVEA